MAAAREKCNWMTGAPFLARLVAPTSGRPPLSELHGGAELRIQGCLEMTISTTCPARPANTENWLEGRIRQMPSHFFLDAQSQVTNGRFSTGNALTLTAGNGSRGDEAETSPPGKYASGHRLPSRSDPPKFGATYSRTTEGRERNSRQWMLKNCSNPRSPA